MSFLEENAGTADLVIYILLPPILGAVRLGYFLVLEDVLHYYVFPGCRNFTPIDLLRVEH